MISNIDFFHKDLINKLLTDVCVSIISSDNKITIHLHKCIIACESDYFFNLFTDVSSVDNYYEINYDYPNIMIDVIRTIYKLPILSDNLDHFELEKYNAMAFLGIKFNAKEIIRIKPKYEYIDLYVKLCNLYVDFFAHHERIIFRKRIDIHHPNIPNNIKRILINPDSNIICLTKDGELMLINSCTHSVIKYPLEYNGNKLNFNGLHVSNYTKLYSYDNMHIYITELTDSTTNILCDLPQEYTNNTKNIIYLFNGLHDNYLSIIDNNNKYITWNIKKNKKKSEIIIGDKYKIFYNNICNIVIDNDGLCYRSIGKHIVTLGKLSNEIRDLISEYDYYIKQGSNDNFLLFVNDRVYIININSICKIRLLNKIPNEIISNSISTNNFIYTFGTRLRIYDAFYQCFRSVLLNNDFNGKICVPSDDIFFFHVTSTGVQICDFYNGIIQDMIPINGVIDISIVNY